MLGDKAATDVLTARGPRGSLVEREHDLAVLGEALADAARGRPGLVVIEGPAGIGKTRLLAEGKRRARDTSVRTLTARGSELEIDLAFGVVRQLFEGKVATNDIQPLAGAITAASEVLSAPPRTAGATGSEDAS
ncbi:MAG: hypothetical protein QOF76_1532, partial [Solirubrobacteraceae bacterium]|nr:hypothetical protein [Solirubrobacteraceae bacterium]